MTLFLEGIVLRTLAENCDSVGSGIDLNCVVSALCDCTCHFQGHTHTGFFIISIALFNYYLNIFE